MNLPISSLGAPSAADLKIENVAENAFGETALPFAPVIATAGIDSATPQQFLEVNRSLGSVEAILACIHTPSNYVLFAGEENGLVYLLCAVIGHENYVKRPEQDDELKIVYGRRWLLEPSTPTSEVIQTALLAVKKAREHELRERVVLRTDVRGEPRSTTPFNCHLDLPLMASELGGSAISEACEHDWSAEALISNICVDNLSLTLTQRHDLGEDRFLYDLRLQGSGKRATSFADMEGIRLSFLCEKNTQAEFLHALFDALLQLSDKQVDECFEFKGFARFSRLICPFIVAEFSYRTRNINQQDARFNEHFVDMSYRVDAAKAPSMNSAELGEIQRKALELAEKNGSALTGYLPDGY